MARQIKPGAFQLEKHILMEKRMAVRQGLVAETFEKAAVIPDGMMALDDLACRNLEPAGPVSIYAPIGIGRQFVAPIIYGDFVGTASPHANK